MSLTSHDEFLHLGFPRTTKDPWKENYYFNFIDRDADALGIFHASFQRHKGVATFRAFNVIGGEPLTYVNEIEWPPREPWAVEETIAVGDGKLAFSILEPYERHRVSLDDGDTQIRLDYRKRFAPFDFHEFDEGDEGDRGLSVAHYEQGMHVEGEIQFAGRTHSIQCLGHRDHTWGFRDETGLGGWNWIAIQCENSTWNFSRVRRLEEDDTMAGFISTKDGAEAINRVEVSSIDANDDGEPIVVKYAVTVEGGKTYHVTATRFTRMFLPSRPGLPVVHHENFSEFVIEETGETGVGIDEHMVVSK